MISLPRFLADWSCYFCGCHDGQHDEDERVDGDVQAKIEEAVDGHAEETDERAEAGRAAKAISRV